MKTTDSMTSLPELQMPSEVLEGLRRIVAALVERFEPERIILFGSYARGGATSDSDVDLLVVMPLPSGSRFATIVEMRQAAAHSPFDKDIVVYTPQEFAEYRDVVGTLAYPAAREGIVLYQRPATRVREEPPGWDHDAVVVRVVRMWVERAEEDWQAIEQLRAVAPPLTRIVCFHAQQCAEKYLKAMLVARQIPFSKTHELGRLLELMPPDLDPGITAQNVAELAPCAVDARYPSGSMPVSVELQAAIDAAAHGRRAARAHLPPGALG